MATIGLYRMGQWCAATLPRGCAYRLAERLADGYRWFVPREARIVQENLRPILGDDPARLRAAAREVFREFGRYLTDFLSPQHIDRAYVAAHIEVTGLEHVEAALADGRGAIALTAHVGHWELCGRITQALGYAVSAVALPHQDPRVNAFFDEQRTRHGMQVIPMGRAGVACLRVLRQRRLLALLADRDYSHHAAVSTAFFGRPTWIPRGPAVLSVRTGRPVVPVFLLRVAGDRFRLVFEPPIYPSSGADEARIVQLTRQYVAILERHIRAHPTQWFMFQPFWRQYELPRPPVVIQNPTSKIHNASLTLFMDRAEEAEG